MSFILKMEEKALNNRGLEPDEAMRLLTCDDSQLFNLISSSDKIRRQFKGNKINLCSIINARSGKCSEDCAFCSQSAHNKSKIREYELLSGDEILSSARVAASHGASKFGIVTSGKGVDKGNDFNEILETIHEISHSRKIQPCASLGILTKDELLALKREGLKEYHHNLETAESFFPEICQTHTYNENVATVRAAKDAGLRVCCGGIFGMGECVEQRVELVFALKELDVDSVPINFLNPVEGTKFEKYQLVKPIEALKLIALFRFMLPKKDIKVAGGREVVLRDLQSMMFAAGANSAMLGNYLTTKGRDGQDDLQMIEDLGLSHDGFYNRKTKSTA